MRKGGRGRGGSDLPLGCLLMAMVAVPAYLHSTYWPRNRVKVHREVVWTGPDDAGLAMCLGRYLLR